MIAGAGVLSIRHPMLNGLFWIKGSKNDLFLPLSAADTRIVSPVRDEDCLGLSRFCFSPHMQPTGDFVQLMIRLWLGSAFALKSQVKKSYDFH